jgi:hypothetical protein
LLQELAIYEATVSNWAVSEDDVAQLAADTRS